MCAPPCAPQATDHARQLVEKYVGKPFFDLPYARGEIVFLLAERESGAVAEFQVKLVQFKPSVRCRPRTHTHTLHLPRPASQACGA